MIRAVANLLLPWIPREFIGNAQTIQIQADSLIIVVNAVNASKEYAFIVKSAVLFGSMLSGVDRLGDVDVAIDLRPRNLDSAKFRQKCDRRRHLAEDLGRAFPSVFEWATWPQKEVVPRLKARSRSLSLHDFDQLMGMENLRYRVLVGDAISIASQISNGCAHCCPVND